MIRYKDSAGNINEIFGMLSTGMSDMEGNELFERDKIQVSNDGNFETFEDEIIYIESAFYIKSTFTRYSEHDYDLKYILEHFDVVKSK